MSNRDDINYKILKAKEYLYTLYTELQNEIEGKQMEMDSDNNEEIIRNIVIPEFIQILKDSIQHLLEKRIDDYKKISENSHKCLKLQDYDPLLKQYEYELRKHYKKEVIARIGIEDLESQIETYERIAKDFDDMKEKLKYEDGQFLNNDRKDHEILILRAEHNNLKNVMRRCEEDKKRSGNLKKKTEEDVEMYKTQIDRLSKKLLTIEVNAKSNINININNNANLGSKWVFNDEDNASNSQNMVRNSNGNDGKIKKSCDSDKTEVPHSERNVLEARIKQIYNNKKKKAKESSSILDSNNATHTYNRLTNEIEEKNIKQSTQQKSNHSSTMKEKNRNDYLKSNLYHISNPLHNQTVKAQSNSNNSNNSMNSNYVKIINLIPSNKIASFNHSHIRHQQLSNLMDKMYMVNNDGSQSANRSSLGLTSKSKGYYN